jgi:signal transduction histidine kinase
MLRKARAQQEMVLRWLRLLGPLLIAFWTLSSLKGASLHGHGLDVSIALAGFCVFGLAAVLLLRRRTGPWPVLCLVALVASSIVLEILQPGGSGVVGLVVGMLLLARRFSRRVALPLSVLVFVFLAVTTVKNGHGGIATGLFGTVAFAGFYGMVFLTNRLGEAIAQAERLLVELDRMQAERARAAALSERQRLAREMHDVLAHSLSGLMLQIEGARMLAAAQEPADPRLAETIDRAHHLARSGLAEARRAIGMLRDEDLPGPERLAALVEEFEADRGVPCEFTVSGTTRVLGSQASLAVYRVAQEALTNITKHANADRVELILSYEPEGTRLTIEDFTSARTGCRPASTDGYGLTGMRERAELIGGELTTAMTRSGFRVELQVPS